MNVDSVANISAIIGGIDEPTKTLPNTFLYTDPIYPNKSFHPRLRAKYFKMCSHHLHPEYKAYIWFDGTFTLKPGFVEWAIDKLGEADCAFFSHVDRTNIVEELEHVVDGIRENDEYIITRYGDDPMTEQVETYLKEMPLNSGLYQGGLFIRRNTPKVNAAFDHWYIENTKWSVQDQLSLPYIIWKHGLTVNTIDSSLLLEGPYHEYNWHLY